MDSVLNLTPVQRRTLFVEVAAKTGINAVLVEKDFWVCWTLKELFALPDIGEHLIFKGGTSLSKVFKIIERFSEDIDVSIDRGFLGFGGDNEPEAGKSANEKRRRIDALRIACQQKISREIAPMLSAAIDKKLKPSDHWALHADEQDPDGQTLLFEYPSAFAVDASGYIRRAVKIEMGARSDHWPHEMGIVTPYVAEQFPKGFATPSCLVKVLSAQRTFWEKATILHAEFNRPAEKSIPERYSRHYYDLYELIRHGIDKPAVANLDLLSRVVEHKGLFFRTTWAKTEEAQRGSLHISPPAFRLPELQADYQRMQQMFFTKPPTFEDIISALGKWEADFNGRHR